MSSQASAQALVQDALQRTRDLRLASGLTAGAQASGASGGTDLSPLLRRHALAVSNYSASLCSSGSASVEVADAVLARFTADPNAKMLPGDTIGVVTSACVIKAGGLQLGSVSLGEFGVGDRIDGSFALKLLSASGSDVMFELSYTDFVYQPYGGTAFDALDAVLRFGTEGGQEVYALEIPQTRFLEAPVVSGVQAALLISSGSLRGKLPAASGTGYADFAYTGWSYDTTTGQAGAGSVAVSGANASKARITAGAGAYSIAITVGGGTASFSVVR